jgi:hypothetical protein
VSSTRICASLPDLDFVSPTLPGPSFSADSADVNVLQPQWHHLGVFRKLTLVVSSVLLLALAGCAGEEPDKAGADQVSPDSTSSAPATTTSPDTSDASDIDQCELLTDAQIAKLAGEPLGGEQPHTIADQLPACVWGTPEKGVQVASASAVDWARGLPAVVDQIKAGGALDAANLQKLEDAAGLISSGDSIPADQACDLFSTLVEANGLPKGSDSIVNVFPNADDPRAISGQACRNDVYTTVLLVRPNLSASDDETQRVERALRQAMGQTPN